MKAKSKSVIWVLAVFATAVLTSTRVRGQTTTRPANATGQASKSEAAMMGRYVRTLSGLGEPVAAYIDARNRIYVAEQWPAGVSVFDRDGRRLEQFDGRDGERPHLRSPAGIAVDSHGAIYVSDSRLSRIAVFDAAGKFQRAIGEYGTGDGQLASPGGVAISGEQLFVADSGNARVQVFSTSGTFEKTLTGDEDGARLRRPVGIAAGVDGQVFVAEADGDRVVILDSDGTVTGTFGETGPFPGLLLEPLGVTAHGGHVFVTERLNHRVQVFDDRGRVLYQWGLHAYRPREGEGKLHYPSATAIAPDGSFAVVCEPFENRCQVFERMPPGQKPPQNPFIGLDPSGGSHYTPWADLDGRFLVTGEIETDKLSIYDASGDEPIMIASIGQRGRLPGQLIRAAGLCLDAVKAALFVADAGNRRLCEFALTLPAEAQLAFVPDMAKLKRVVLLDELHASDERMRVLSPFEPGAVTCSERHVFVSDLRSGAIVKFDRNLALAAVWSDAQDARDGPRCPIDMATMQSEAGELLLVADAAHSRIVGLDANGRQLFTWPLENGGRPVRPAGICVGPGGAVYVSDSGGHGVIELTSKGKVARRWGRPGIGAGELFRPAAVRPLLNRELMVIDYGNHRGAFFGFDGTYRRVFGSRLFTGPARNKSASGN